MTKRMFFVLAGLAAALAAQPATHSDTIGGTVYDWQQSGPALTTIVNDPAYGIHATWMFSANSSNFPDRNKGYNFRDRASGQWSWIDPGNFMNSGALGYSAKVGYGSLDVNPSTGCAYISAHYTVTPSIVKDLSPGAGVFEECGGPPACSGYVWPVSMMTSDEVVHNALIDAATRSQVWYSRITPWCAWSAPFYVSEPPANNPSYPSHSLAASRQSNTVIIAWSDPLNLPTQLFLRISTDGGLNWDPAFTLPPPPAFSPGSDTTPVYFLTGAFIAFDRNDRWHLVTDVIPMVGGVSYIMPAEVWHYSPDAAPNWSRIQRAECDTLRLAGMVGDNAVLACRPSIGFSAANDECFVVWEQFDSLNVEPSNNLLRADIWVAGSRDNGQTWSAPLRLTEPDETSKRFPCLARLVDDTLRIVYEQDMSAGFCIPQHQQGPATNNPIIYLQLPASDVGISEQSFPAPSPVSIRAVPNPFRDQVCLEVSAGHRMTRLTVFDASGRQVCRLRFSDREQRQAYWNGCNQQGQRLPAGSYFIEARAGSRTLRTRVVLGD